MDEPQTDSGHDAWCWVACQHDPPYTEPVRRVSLTVTFEIHSTPSYSDTDASLAAYLRDYLNADEIGGLPFCVVPNTFDLTPTDQPEG